MTYISLETLESTHTCDIGIVVCKTCESQGSFKLKFILNYCPLNATFSNTGCAQDAIK